MDPKYNNYTVLYGKRYRTVSYSYPTPSKEYCYSTIYIPSFFLLLYTPHSPSPSPSPVAAVWLKQMDTRIPYILMGA